jgi:hypothetical protein
MQLLVYLTQQIKVTAVIDNFINRDWHLSLVTAEGRVHCNICYFSLEA